MKILVTGATGFIGSNLANALLNAGHRLTLLVRNPHRLSEKFVAASHVIAYDGTLESVEKAFAGDIDLVIHAASNFIAEHKSGDVDGLISSNVLFGAQLLEAMQNAGAKRLINFGTSWQHFENADYNPVCLYAATKQAFEDIAKFYVEARGFGVIHLKLFDTYGPGDERPKLIRTLLRIAKSGESLQMSPGEQLIDLVHVSDVVSAVEIAIAEITKADFKGIKTYSISQGERLTLRNLVATISEICGKEIRIEWGARPYRQREVFEPWISGVAPPGWKPKIPLKTGLRELWAGGQR